MDAVEFSSRIERLDDAQRHALDVLICVMIDHPSSLPPLVEESFDGSLLTLVQFLEALRHDFSFRS
jgi:hypothetical protein